LENKQSAKHKSAKNKPKNNQSGPQVFKKIRKFRKKQNRIRKKAASLATLALNPNCKDIPLRGTSNHSLNCDVIGKFGANRTRVEMNLVPMEP